MSAKIVSFSDIIFSFIFVQALPVGCRHSNGVVAGGLQGCRRYPRPHDLVQEGLPAENDGQLLPEARSGFLEVWQLSLPRRSHLQALPGLTIFVCAVGQADLVKSFCRRYFI